METEKNNNPILAICYDFDKTLSPEDMQAQGYIQSLGLTVSKFWEESNDLAKEHEMDKNLAYMWKMVEESRGIFYNSKEKLASDGSKIEFFPGVQEWFSRINSYGLEHGICIEHYVISSGLKEMIEGTSIAKEFKKIYASSFFFDDHGVPIWPAQVVNYTNKTQFLFRIEKGVLDVNDDKVNSQMPEDQRRIPFRNIVYIGDSATDIPCMTVVNNRGGHSVGVYNPSSGGKSKVIDLIKGNRIKYFAAADYQDGQELDSLIKSIIDWTSSNEKLMGRHFKCYTEAAERINETEMAKTLEGASKIVQKSELNFQDILKDFQKTASLISELRKDQFVMQNPFQEMQASKIQSYIREIERQRILCDLEIPRLTNEGDKEKNDK